MCHVRMPSCQDANDEEYHEWSEEHGEAEATERAKGRAVLAGHKQRHGFAQRHAGGRSAQQLAHRLWSHSLLECRLVASALEVVQVHVRLMLHVRMLLMSCARRVTMYVCVCMSAHNPIQICGWVGVPPHSLWSSCSDRHCARHVTRIQTGAHK